MSEKLTKKMDSLQKMKRGLSKKKQNPWMIFIYINIQGNAKRSHSGKLFYIHQRQRPKRSQNTKSCWESRVWGTLLTGVNKMVLSPLRKLIISWKVGEVHTYDLAIPLPIRSPKETLMCMNQKTYEDAHSFISVNLCFQ